MGDDWLWTSKAAPKNCVGLFQTQVMLLLTIMLIYDESLLKDHLPSIQVGLEINFLNN